MSKVDSESAEGYRPDVEFMEDNREALVDLNLTNSTELLLFQFPSSTDLLSEIDGQSLSLNLHHDYQLASYVDLNGKAYDFCSFSKPVAAATVFISSATEKKIAGNLSRQVTVGHYPDPEELNRRSSTNARQASLSGVAEPSTTSKSNRVTKSKSSHGNRTDISAVTSHHSHRGK